MDETREGTAWFGKTIRREFRVTVGQRYIVDPLNPRRRKNRGRTCVVVGFENDDMAIVRFDDNGRSGREDPGELVAMSESATPAGAGQVTAATTAVVAALRASIGGPYAHDPELERLLQRAVATPAKEVGSPDRPDYVQEAMCRALGLVHVGDLAAATGEMLLALEDLERDCVEGAGQLARNRNATSAEDLVACVSEAARAAGDRFIARVRKARADLGVDVGPRGNG